MKILLVEDDPRLGDAVREALSDAHHVVEWVASIEAVRTRLAMDRYELCVLDLGLPDAQGYESVVAVRRLQASLPILVISAIDDIGERIRALDAGADDYLVKPFDLAELLARVRAALRRPAGLSESRLTVGSVDVDLAACVVRVNGEEVKLRRREYQILLALLTRRGHVLSRQQLEDAVSSGESSVESNAVEVVIHHLRRKLGENFIETVRGIGYVIRDAAA